jgi:hypothetical protein
MNNIGIGIMCFGDDYYFHTTKDKIINFNLLNLPCYVLTDNKYFFNNLNVNIIEYDRNIKSYHDKIILAKKILNDLDICILIDADVLIIDYSVFNKLKEYNIKKGITYIDTLLNHTSKFQFIKDIDMSPYQIGWNEYAKYIELFYPDFIELETIYEYFIILNKDGISNQFFKTFETLQIVKEYCDIIKKHNNKILGPGEGVSIQISAKISESQIQRDNELYEILNKKIINKISR